MIIGAIVEGLYISQGTNQFGKDGDKTNYNYIKVLIGEEVAMIRITDDKVQEIKEADFKQYQHIEIMIDIKMESESDVSSKFKSSLIYAGQVPFDIKDREEGKEKKK